MRRVPERLARVCRTASRSLFCGVAVAAAAVSAVPPASAQSGPAPATPPIQESSTSPADAFLTRAAFSFGWGSLASSDIRFDWRATVGFDIDVIEYGTGRLSFHGDYEAILGHERRRFDVNQGSYGFEIDASSVRPAVEIVGFFEHVSRHVSDRELMTHVAWNGLGGRIRSRWTPTGGFSGATHVPPSDPLVIDGQAEIVRAMQQSFVDYGWIARANVSMSRRMSLFVDVIGAAGVELINTREPSDREGCACGGLVEGGLRVRGTGAAIEATAGYERRIDAYPTERSPHSWLTLGVRVVTLDRR